MRSLFMLQSTPMRQERPYFEIAEALKGVGPISFDIDGVVVYTAVKALDRINKRLKANYKLIDMLEPFAFRKWMEADPNIKDPTKEDYALWNSEAVMSYAPVVPGAPMTCRLLNEIGHPHYFVTSRP